MKSFTPKNFYTRAGKNTPFKEGSTQKVKYIAFTEIKNTLEDISRGAVMIEQYYHSNFAKTEKTTMQNLKSIDGFENATDDNIGLYNAVFNKKEGGV